MLKSICRLFGNLVETILELTFLSTFNNNYRLISEINLKPYVSGLIIMLPPVYIFKKREINIRTSNKNQLSL